MTATREEVGFPPFPYSARAACLGADPDLWFPDRRDDENTSPAKKVCAGCDVRTECLDYALEHNIRFGVWGGQSSRERKQIAQHRQPTHPPPAASPFISLLTPDELKARRDDQAWLLRELVAVIRPVVEDDIEQRTRARTERRLATMKGANQ